MKKALTVMIVVAAAVAGALFLLYREEKRLRAVYRQLDERLNFKKSPMQVEF